MTTFERWAVIDAERKAAERRAQLERQRIRKEAERLAEIQHAENVRAEALRNQHTVWREANQLREFLDAMTAVIDGTAAGPQHDEAVAWLSWCRRYVDISLDPLSGSLRMPPIRHPTWEERLALENLFTRKLELANQQRNP